MLRSRDATETLRAAGLRVTPQRLAVIRALATDTSHPSADDIAQRLSEQIPGLSLSTVYKTLHELSALGLVRQIDIGGTMRFDPDPGAHLHIVCGRCGLVTDAPLPDVVASALEGATPPSAGRVVGFDAIVHVTCATCRDEDEPAVEADTTMDT